MNDYTPNSHRFKEGAADNSTEKKKVDKVIQGNAKLKKKNEIGKLKDVFISEDVHNVKNYILMDVLVPAIKKAVSDIVTNGIDMVLYGSTGHSTKKTMGSRVAYNSLYDKDNRERRFSDSTTRDGYNHDDIIVDSRGEAEDVISQMQDLIDTYGYVSVADLYDLIGITGKHTDNKYGWKNIRNAEPVRVRDGYLLKLPKVIPLD